MVPECFVVVGIAAVLWPVAEAVVRRVGMVSVCEVDVTDEVEEV